MNRRQFLLTAFLAATPWLGLGVGNDLRKQALRQANGFNIAESFERKQMIPFFLGTMAPLTSQLETIAAENEQRQRAYYARRAKKKPCSLKNCVEYRLPEEQLITIPLEQCLTAYVHGSMLLNTTAEKASDDPDSFAALEQSTVTDEEKQMAQELKASVQKTVKTVLETLQSAAVFGTIIPPERYESKIAQAKEFANALAPFSKDSLFFSTLQRQAKETISGDKNPLTADLRTSQVEYQELFKLESPWMTALNTEIKTRYTLSTKKVLSIPLPTISRDVLSAKVDLTRCQIDAFNDKTRAALKAADTCMQTYFGKLPLFTTQLANIYQTIISSGISVILARSIANEISAKSTALQTAFIDLLKKAFKKKKDLLEDLDSFVADANTYETFRAKVAPILTKKEVKNAEDLEKDFHDDTDSLQQTLIKCIIEIPEIESTQEVVTLKQNLLQLYRLFALCHNQNFDEREVISARFPLKPATTEGNSRSDEVD